MLNRDTKVPSIVPMHFEVGEKPTWPHPRGVAAKVGEAVTLRALLPGIPEISMSRRSIV